MPDVLHWLGITKIHNFISMSDMKYNAIVESGIKIVNRVEIPPEMVPPEMVPKDAQVEIAAKVFHGHHQCINQIAARLHRRDASSMVWRWGLSPLDSVGTVTFSPRNDLVKNPRGHGTHWFTHRLPRGCRLRGHG